MQTPNAHSFFETNPYNSDIRLVTGTTAITQFPNVPVLLVRFKSDENNFGTFRLTTASGTNRYWELGAGDDTGWLPMRNMNQLYYFDPSGTMDKVAYWMLY